MHGDYVDRAIIPDSQLHYFDANTYDEYYIFSINNCVHHAATLQAHSYSIIPSYLVQILQCGVQRKEGNYNSLIPLFSWLTDDIIKRKFLTTTQYYHMAMSYILKNNYS